MRTGLIPPRGLENFALRSKFHLALAIPELMDRRVYGGMYTRAVTLGDFVVLDNGLAEGRPASSEALLTYAKRIRAQEVVLPDALRNTEKTLELVTTFFKNYAPLDHNYMAVVQGKNIMELRYSIDQYCRMPYVHTLGIPRHLLETIETKSCRIDLATWIYDTYPNRFDIHFLGTNPVWLSEIRFASKYTPFVRSVDSSMPFSYTLAGEELATTTKQITRPPKYFDIDWSRRVQGELLRKNIETFMEWADASGTRSEESISRMRSVSTSTMQVRPQ